jgi:hypothetical protein
MALENVGKSFDIDKFKKKLKDLYPEYNFDVPVAPDTKCKSPYFCDSKDKIKYSDTEGNLYCGLRYKLQDDKNPFKWEYATCHALIESVDEQAQWEEKQGDIF